MLDDGLQGLVGHPPQPSEDHVGKAQHTCTRVLAAVPAGEREISERLAINFFIDFGLYSHNGQHWYLSKLVTLSDNEDVVGLIKRNLLTAFSILPSSSANPWKRDAKWKGMQSET